MDIRPIKLHAVASHSKVQYGKRKIHQVKGKLEEKRLSLQSQVAASLTVSTESLEEHKEHLPENLEEMVQKSKDLDQLIFLMKEKLKTSNRTRKIQILTMIPPSWSIKKAQEAFSVSASIVRTARKLSEEKGILELPDRKCGKRLPNEIATLVMEFYSDDEYSRQMPGKKDSVSIKKNVPMQKRLLLYGLREFYKAFKDKYPQVSLGFSKFCSLRPKWCILVGSAGTHSVCVCTNHQNILLMMNAFQIGKTNQELTDMVVCSRDSKDCMLHRCEKCPGVSNAKVYLGE